MSEKHSVTLARSDTLTWNYTLARSVTLERRHFCTEYNNCM